MKLVEAFKMVSSPTTLIVDVWLPISPDRVTIKRETKIWTLLWLNSLWKIEAHVNLPHDCGRRSEEQIWLTTSYRQACIY
jgi:hypothetical protein